MIVQSTSALFSTTAIARSASSRQNLSALPANTADTVSISQAARDCYAVHATQAKPAASAGSGAEAEFATTKGTMDLNIESYFAPPSGQDVSLDSVPLLLPNQKNIDALSSYISAHMPGFLADNGIPTPPASITYDTMGKIQFSSNRHYDAIALNFTSGGMLSITHDGKPLSEA